MLSLQIQTHIFTIYEKTDKFIFSLFLQAWRRLRVIGHHLCQTTWTKLTTSLSSKAQLLASDPNASRRTSFPVSSRQLSLQAFQHHCVRLFVTSVSDPVLCFSPQSTMRAWWRTCRYAKYSQCDFCIDKKNERLSACLASGQTIPLPPCCVLILLCCVCSEVQDRWPANEAVPQRKPPQEVALR